MIQDMLWNSDDSSPFSLGNENITVESISTDRIMPQIQSKPSGTT